MQLHEQKPLSYFMSGDIETGTFHRTGCQRITDQIKTQDFPTSDFINEATPSYLSSALADKESTETKFPASQTRKCSCSQNMVLIGRCSLAGKNTSNILSFRLRCAHSNRCCWVFQLTGWRAEKG